MASSRQRIDGRCLRVGQTSLYPWIVCTKTFAGPGGNRAFRLYSDPEEHPRLLVGAVLLPFDVAELILPDSLDNTSYGNSSLGFLDNVAADPFQFATVFRFSCRLECLDAGNPVAVLPVFPDIPQERSRYLLNVLSTTALCLHIPIVRPSAPNVTDFPSTHSSDTTNCPGTSHARFIAK